MEPAEVRRQIDKIAEAGWGGIMIHSRIGLITPYLGNEWFDAVDAAIEQCRKYQLNVWLYDEDKWPSGFSGGTVPLANESFHMKTLIARSVHSAIPENVSPIGSPVNDLQIYKWTAPLGHAFFNGTCFPDHMSRPAMQKFIEEAYESYYQRYRDDYGQLIVAEFTDEPCTIFRRRLPIGSVPYTDELLEAFEQEYSYNPINKLHLLFVNSVDAQQFRIHYFRIINKLFEKNYSAQIGEWCRSHNIHLTGHYILEGGLYDQQCWGVNIMPNYRHMGIPGIDHLCRQIEERVSAKQCQSVANQYGQKRLISEMYGCAGQSLTFEDRLWIASQQMALGVNMLNYHLSLYTMAGCRKRDCPPNIFYQQPWWPVNKAIDEPLSRTCFALSQGQFHAEMLIIHPQESTFALWQSKAIYTPTQEDFTLAEYDEEPTAKGIKQTITSIEKEFLSLINVMLSSQRTFDFGAEAILADIGKVEFVDGQPVICMGQMRYALVILPGMLTIATTTLDLLEEFHRKGGQIIRCGQAPQLLDGIPSSRLAKWLEAIPSVTIDDVPIRIKTVIPPAVELVDANSEDARMLYVHIRNLGNDRLIYLVNLHRTRAFNASIKLHGQFNSVHQLDTITGEQTELKAIVDSNGLMVELPFAQTQSHLLLLSPKSADNKQISPIVNNPKRKSSFAPEEIKVERLDDNAITLDYASWREGTNDWASMPMPVIAIQERLNIIQYNGVLALRYPVHIQSLDKNRKVHLVIEYPDKYEIRVNQYPVKYNGLPFHIDFRWMPIDITGLLHEGRNTIELLCNNFQYGDLKIIKDQASRYGTEIEAIYLVGDFAVQGTPTNAKPASARWHAYGLPPIDVQCFAGDSFYLTNPIDLKFGDTTVQGLPFYAGRLKLSAKIPNVDLDGCKTFIEIDKLDVACGEVIVNAKTSGYFISHPFRVELKDISVDNSKQFSIILYSTLRNLLGPHHHAEGELTDTGPNCFKPWHGTQYEESPEVAKLLIDWTKGKHVPSKWKDDYCMVSFGNLGQIRIVNY
ncbi:MAG: hypothetical protein A2Y13_02320 [Planctomycetes bacterium GWC2_45_44]|nr:MAG: hypothetical protein A2Y13_02320 [Planctomycetes bacterium GWC2_45_44]